MTGIPDFTKVDFATFAPPASLPSGSVEPGAIFRVVFSARHGPPVDG